MGVGGKFAIKVHELLDDLDERATGAGLAFQFGDAGVAAGFGQLAHAAGKASAQGLDSRVQRALARVRCRQLIFLNFQLELQPAAAAFLPSEVSVAG